MTPDFEWSENEIKQVLYQSGSFTEDEIERRTYFPAFRDVIRSKLTEREQIVLHRRYAEGKTLDQIAKEFSVTRERIRQIDAKTMRKLTWVQIRSNYIMTLTKDLNSVQKQIRDIQTYVTDLDNALNRLEVTSAMSTQMYDKIHRIMQRLKIASGVMTDDDAVELNELDISVRLYNCLARRGIHDLRLISTMTPSEIIKIRNLGRHTYEELLEVCNRYGIKPKDE